MVGCDFGGHVHIEDDETNPTVLTTTSTDDRRRPATRGQRRRLGLRGDGELNGGGAAARRHGRARERGQTKEGDEVVLFIALD